MVLKFYQIGDFVHGPNLLANLKHTKYGVLQLYKGIRISCMQLHNLVSKEIHLIRCAWELIDGLSSTHHGKDAALPFCIAGPKTYLTVLWYCVILLNAFWYFVILLHAFWASPKIVTLGLVHCFWLRTLPTTSLVCVDSVRQVHCTSCLSLILPGCSSTCRHLLMINIFFRS